MFPGVEGSFNNPRGGDKDFTEGMPLTYLELSKPTPLQTPTYPTLRQLGAGARQSRRNLPDLPPRTYPTLSPRRQKSFSTIAFNLDKEEKSDVKRLRHNLSQLRGRFLKKGVEIPREVLVNISTGQHFYSTDTLDYKKQTWNT